MAEDPNLDLPEVDEKEGFPWVTIVAIVAVFLVGGAWLYYGKGYHTGGDTVVAALEQQLANEKVAWDAEKQKVIDVTNELDALKQKIALGQAGNKAEAVAHYNQLAKEQNEQ